MTNQQLINAIVDYLRKHLSKCTCVLVDTILIITYNNLVTKTQCEIIFDESRIKIYNSQDGVSILDSTIEYANPTMLNDILVNIADIMNGKSLESSIIINILHDDYWPT